MKLESEKVILSSPMSFAGAFQRWQKLWHRTGRPIYQWCQKLLPRTDCQTDTLQIFVRILGVYLLVSHYLFLFVPLLVLILIAYLFIVALWYIPFVIFIIVSLPWRLFRRHQRLVKKRDLQHREMLEAMQRHKNS